MKRTTPRRVAALTILTTAAALATLAPSIAAAAELETCGSCGGGFGQQVLDGTDDASTDAIEMTALPDGINFFGVLHTHVFVNSNGNITFGSGVTGFTPTPFPVSDQPMIAPFWGDVDLGGTGALFFANDTDGGRFIVTWSDVGYFAGKTDKINNFQIIIADRSDVGAPGDFDVEFRYQRLEWTTGDASGGSGGLGGTPAQAGFDAGDQVNHVTLIGSRSAEVLDLVGRSNVDEPGVWRFPIRNGVVPACGNGALEEGEGCDDGGNNDFDGCNATCQPEAPPANRPPTVDAAGPYLISEGEALTLRANAQDPDGDPLTFAWDLGSGLFEDGSRPTLSFVVGDGPDSFGARVRVSDGAEIAEASAQVQITNLPPTIASLICATDEGQGCDGSGLEGLDLEGLGLEGVDVEWIALESAPLIFSAVASDPGGDDLELTWDFGDGSPRVSGQEVIHAFADGGLFAVTLTATDDDGAATTATRVIFVGDAPAGVSTLSGPEQLEEGQEGRWTLHISKARFDAVTWTIAPGDGSKVLTGESTKEGEVDTASFAHAFARPGRYEMEVALIDDDGQASRVARSIEVTNRAPEITRVTIPSIGVEGAELIFSASAIDEAGALEFSWDFGDGGPAGSGAQVAHIFRQDGDFAVTLRVSDAFGGVALRRAAIQIRNAAPAIVAFDVPSVVEEGQRVEVRVEAVDPGRDAMTFIWDFGDGEEPVRSQRPDETHVWPDDGRFEVVVAVEDNQGGRAVRRQRVSVVNVAPRILSAPPVESFARRLYTYRIETQDPGADLLQFEIVEGPEGMILEGDTLVWTPEVAARLPEAVAIRVEDGDGGVARQSWVLQPVEVDLDNDGVADDCEARFGLDTSVDDADEDLDQDGLTNAQECQRGTDPKQYNGPSAPSPVSPRRDAEVSARPELRVSNAVDPDGDRLAYAFEVYEDEALQSAVATSEPVPAGHLTTAWVVDQALKENTTYWWRARAADPNTSGAFGPASRFVVNANNEPPGVPSPVSPVGVIAQVSPEFVVTASEDPEGEPVEIVIEVFEDEAMTGFVGQGRTRGASLRLEGALGLGETYWWRAQAEDAQGGRSGWSQVASFEISARNRRPFAPSITQPSPGSVVGEVVQVVWHPAQDPEGDRLTYDIQLATDATFQTIVIEETDVEATGQGAIARQFEGLTPGSPYALRIVASDALGRGVAAEVTFSASQEALPAARVSPLEEGGPVEQVEGGSLAFSIVGGAPEGCGQVRQLLSIFEGVSMERQVMAMSGSASRGQTTMVWESPREGALAWTLTTRCKLGDVVVENTSLIKEFEIKFVEDNAPPEVPVLRWPAPEAELGGGAAQEFRVRNAADPDGDRVSYRFEIFADEAMTERLSIEEVTEGEAGETTAVIALGRRPGRAVWVVTAIDARGASARSAPQGFYVKEEARGCSTAPSGGPRGGLWVLILLGLALARLASRRS